VELEAQGKSIPFNSSQKKRGGSYLRKSHHGFEEGATIDDKAMAG
jgi:hypothetical protein